MAAGRSYQYFPQICIIESVKKKIMKKVLCSILLLTGLATGANAQDSLTATGQNPVLGQVFIANTCDTTGVTEGAAGAGVSWNFSGLTVVSMDTGIAVTCASTPNCSMFPGTTIAIKSNTGTTVNYAIATTSAYSQNGYYYSSAQYATLSDPMDQLHYPMNYLDSFVDTYAGIINYTSAIPITAHENGTVQVKYDAYGTLTLPDTTYYNAMRTHSYQMFVDSASVFGIDTVASFILHSYTWYVKNIHSAVLTIMTTDQIGGGIHSKIVNYGKRYTGSLGVADISNASATLNVYPNPSTGMVNISLGGVSTGNEKITLTDLLGRQVAEIAAGQQHISYDASALPKGVYLVRLQNGAQVVTRKLELQ
jgi:hypothetical protein